MLHKKHIGRLLFGLWLLLPACAIEQATPPQATVAPVEANPAAVPLKQPEQDTSQTEAVAPEERIVGHDLPATEDIAEPPLSAAKGDKMDTMAGEEPDMAVAGPSPEQARLLAGLKSKGVAPGVHNEAWLNTQPLKWDDLRGKVVMIEFWTFG